MNNVNNPLQQAKALTDTWSPKIIGEVDDSYIKVAKLHGTFTWHSHDNEDEVFIVLEGQLKIELKDGEVILNTGDMYVVPKGVEHNPIAENECLVMLFEKKSTAHTGNVITEQTRSVEQQLS